jgi:hypothetical protein
VGTATEERAVTAAQLLGACESEHLRMGTKPDPFERRDLAAAREAVVAVLGDEATGALTTGADMDRDAAVLAALQALTIVTP